MPCASRACTSAHHGANHLPPPTGAWPCSSCGSVGDRWLLHAAQVLTTAPGGAWPSDGHALHAPRVAVWVTVGSCSCPLPIPRLVSEIVDWCWRPADVASCRACVGTRVVPCGVGTAVVPRSWWCAAGAVPLPRPSLLSRRRTPLGRGAETPGECMTCSVTVPRDERCRAVCAAGRHATLPTPPRGRPPGPVSGPRRRARRRAAGGSVRRPPTVHGTGFSG